MQNHRSIKDNSKLIKRKIMKPTGLKNLTVINIEYYYFDFRTVKKIILLL
jgi:hypothetical protein